MPDIVIGLGSYNIKVPSLVDKIEKRSRAKPSIREKDDFIIRFISKEVDDILNSLGNNGFLKSERRMMSILETSEPKRDRFLPNTKREHKNDELFRLKYVVKNDMNKIVAVFAGELRDNMFDSEVVDFIRVIVRIIEESTNTSVDRVRLNKVKLIAFTIKSDRVSDTGPRRNHGSENFRKNIKKRFREGKIRKEISKTT